MTWAQGTDLLTFLGVVMSSLFAVGLGVRRNQRRQAREVRHADTVEMITRLAQEAQRELDRIREESLRLAEDHQQTRRKVESLQRQDDLLRDAEQLQTMIETSRKTGNLARVKILMGQMREVLDQVELVQTNTRRGAVEMTTEQHRRYQRIVDDLTMLRAEETGALQRGEDARVEACRRRIVSLVGELDEIMVAIGSPLRPSVPLLQVGGALAPMDAARIRSDFETRGARNGDIVVLGPGMTFEQSTDGGRTWTPEPEPKPDPDPTPCLEGRDRHDSVPVDGLPEQVPPRWLCPHCLADVDADGADVTIAPYEPPKPKRLRPQP